MANALEAFSRASHDIIMDRTAHPAMTGANFGKLFDVFDAQYAIPEERAKCALHVLTKNLPLSVSEFVDISPSCRLYSFTSLADMLTLSVRPGTS